MAKSVFYHVGCPVFVSAEQEILNLLNPEDVEVAHLGEEKSKIKDAESAGVQSVPALDTPNGHVLHINFGTSPADVKG